MGLKKGFLKVLLDLFPGVARHPQPGSHRLPLSWDGQAPAAVHVYLDCNNLLYRAARRASEEEMMYRLRETLRTLLRAFAEPTASVFLALDGPAPWAKIALQRERRFKRSSSPSSPSGSVDEEVDVLQFTPGTPMMDRLKAELEALACRLLLTSRFGATRFFVSGADRDGEGEFKIFEHISRYLLPRLAQRARLQNSGAGTADGNGGTGGKEGTGGKNSSWEAVVVCGNDSDLVLFALHAQEALVAAGLGEMARLFVLRTEGSLASSLLIDCAALREAIGCGLPRPSEALRDFTLLATLGGNDYLPSLPGLSFLPSVWNMYRRLAVSAPELATPLYLAEERRLHLRRLLALANTRIARRLIEAGQIDPQSLLRQTVRRILPNALLRYELVSRSLAPDLRFFECRLCLDRSAVAVESDSAAAGAMPPPPPPPLVLLATEFSTRSELARRYVALSALRRLVGVPEEEQQQQQKGNEDEAAATLRELRGALSGQEHARLVEQVAQLEPPPNLLGLESRLLREGLEQCLPGQAARDLHRRAEELARVALPPEAERQDEPAVLSEELDGTLEDDLGVPRRPHAPHQLAIAVPRAVGGTAVVDDEETEKARAYAHGLLWMMAYLEARCVTHRFNYAWDSGPAPEALRRLQDAELPEPSGETSPLRPIETLLALLPPRGAHLVPPAWRHLLEPGSPVADLLLETDGDSPAWTQRLPETLRRLEEAVRRVPPESLSVRERALLTFQPTLLFERRQEALGRRPETLLEPSDLRALAESRPSSSSSSSSSGEGFSCSTQEMRFDVLWTDAAGRWSRSRFVGNRAPVLLPPSAAVGGSVRGALPHGAMPTAPAQAVRGPARLPLLQAKLPQTAARKRHSSHAGYPHSQYPQKQHMLPELAAEQQQSQASSQEHRGQREQREQWATRQTGAVSAVGRPADAGLHYFRRPTLAEGAAAAAALAAATAASPSSTSPSSPPVTAPTAASTQIEANPVFQPAPSVPPVSARPPPPPLPRDDVSSFSTKPAGHSIRAPSSSAAAPPPLLRDERPAPSSSAPIVPPRRSVFSSLISKWFGQTVLLLSSSSCSPSSSSVSFFFFFMLLSVPRILHLDEPRHTLSSTCAQIFSSSSEVHRSLNARKCE